MNNCALTDYLAGLRRDRPFTTVEIIRAATGLSAARLYLDGNEYDCSSAAWRTLNRFQLEREILCAAWQLGADSCTRIIRGKTARWRFAITYGLPQEAIAGLRKADHTLQTDGTRRGLPGFRRNHYMVVASRFAAGQHSVIFKMTPPPNILLDSSQQSYLMMPNPPKPPKTR